MERWDFTNFREIIYQVIYVLQVNYKILFLRDMKKTLVNFAGIILLFSLSL